MTKSDGHSILLIEKLSLSNLIYLLVTGKTNRDSYFVYPDTIISHLGRIPFFFNIQQKITKKIEYADLPGSYFAAEEEGYQTAVDSIFDKNADNLYIKIAMAYCGDPLYRLALKKELYNRYSQQRVKAFTILKYLSETLPEVPITFIPSDNEAIIPLLSSGFINTSCCEIPSYIKFLNHIRSGIQIALTLGLFPFYLIIISAGYPFRGFNWKPHIKNYDFGFDNFNSGINFKNPYEFFFLFDFKKLHPKKTLQVVRNGFENSGNSSKTRLFFERLGYPYVEHDKVRIPLELYAKKICMKFLFGGFYSYVKNMFTSNWNGSYAIPALAVMKMTIGAEIFYSQNDVKVFIARDEYSPFHIVRTLVARAHGNATVGFSHGDDCHHTSALNYLVFDKYAVWGEYYRVHLKKSLQYSDTTVIGAGIYGLDKTFSFQSHHQIPLKYRIIKNEFKIIGIFASSFTPELYITKERTLHFYKTVLDLTENYSEYYRVIKPKGDEFNDPEFQELLRNRKRVIIENVMWTYRLLSSLDTLICINITTIGLEGLMAGKKVFYYDVTNNKIISLCRYSEGLGAFEESTLKRKS